VQSWVLKNAGLNGIILAPKELNLERGTSECCK